MDITQRLQIYLRRRKADGMFLFPNSVRAHYDEIMQYMPDALTDKEKRVFGEAKTRDITLSIQTK